MEQSEDRLRAFCSITMDHSFVVRDLKIIDGSNGPFVAMPSRKLSGHCVRCGYKNHLRAAYCNQCGVKLRLTPASDSPQKLYADVAHPINSDCREMISAAVLAEFEAELKRASVPGYRSRYDDEFEAISESDDDSFARIDPPMTQSSSPQAIDPALSNFAETPAAQNPSPPAPHLDRAASPEKTASPPAHPDPSFGAGIFE